MNTLIITITMIAAHKNLQRQLEKAYEEGDYSITDAYEHDIKNKYYEFGYWLMILMFGIIWPITWIFLIYVHSDILKRR